MDKMRIGYVLGVFPKLSETFILNEIIELKKRGHEVIIFSLFSPKENIMHPEIKKFNLLKDVYYLPNPLKFINKIKLGLKSLGFFGWKYPSESLKDKILAIAATKYFSEIAKELKLDILHAHFNGTATQVAMLMSKKLDIPFTFTIHAIDIFVNLNIKSLKERINDSLQTITISNFNKRYLENLTNVSRKKISIIHACPNLDEIDKFKSSEKENEK